MREKKAAATPLVGPGGFPLVKSEIIALIWSLCNHPGNRGFPNNTFPTDFKSNQTNITLFNGIEMG